MDQNICHFIPFHKDHHTIHTINFVNETQRQTYDWLKIESVYKMHYVYGGQGYLHTVGNVMPLTKGDLFFTFPSVPFAIESKENFAYMYISFVGLRGNELMEKFNVNTKNFIFHNADELYDFWERGIHANAQVSDLISESLLLYTFSFLGNRLLPEKKESNLHHTVELIKKYIDDHFSEQNFTLEKMSADLSYNKKYISHIFKQQTKIGIIEYVNTIRIQNACAMIAQGFTSITDIADRCGYSDALYFSKIFKAKMGVTPTQHIKDIKNKGS